MATSHLFDNRVIKLPGVYSNIKAASPSSFGTASYSKVLILNTNPAYAFGGSVNGEITKGGDALYKFSTLAESRNFFKSGYIWQLVEALFRPSRLEGRRGISELQFMNALTTTASTITLTLQSGSLILKTKDEGTNANGEKVGSTNILKKGYALTMEKGVKDPSKYIIKIYQSSYKGEWANDKLPFDFVPAESCQNELVIETPEISSVDDFVTWAQLSPEFSAGFVISESQKGEFAEEDITSNKFVLSTGATGTYQAKDLEAAMELLKKGDFSVILSLQKIGEDGADTIHATLQHFVQSETKFKKYLAIPGSDELNTTIAAAKKFNSERVWVVPGKPRKSSSQMPQGFRIYDSVYMTALVVGRICGLPPQVPGTFKDLNIDGIETPLSTAQLEECLDAGVMTVNFDDELGYYCITRAINTLQDNDRLQNPNGSTFSIQISRICTQLNTEVVVNAKREVFGSNETANVFTISPAFLKNWVKTFLSTKIATPQQDNLILGIGDIDVRRQGDAYFVTYSFRTNSEIAFVFITGIAIN